MESEPVSAPSPGKSEVIVIGGGIIGVACADALARRGVGVVVNDKAQQIGHGCSYGNAGWITPCFALPLPMPGMLLQAIGWMLDPQGPLYVKPRLSLDLARWLWRFTRSMNHSLLHESVNALVPLAQASLRDYLELDAESPGAFGLERKGLLIVAQTPAGRDAAAKELDLVAPLGVRGELLDAAGVRRVEPAVTGREIAGGVYFPDEAHCEPLAAVQALAERARRHGAVFLPQTEVYGLERQGRRIKSLRTTRGTMAADQYVLASGAWSAALGRKLGVRIPLLSGKGYAMTVPRFDPAPAVPLMLIEKKIAVTPRQQGIRLSGTLELVGLDESIAPKRVEAIARGARQYLNVPEHPVETEVWRGLRPCTPDGVPVIGRPSGAAENVVIATGHQMLGLLTAPSTGTLVAELITGARPSLDPHPFRATRF